MSSAFTASKEFHLALKQLLRYCSIFLINSKLDHFRTSRKPEVVVEDMCSKDEKGNFLNFCRHYFVFDNRISYGYIK